MDGSSILRIKDSVDLFLGNDVYLTAYYMNTRRRKSFKISNEVKYLIENIDGEKTVEELYRIMYGVGVEADEVDDVLKMMLDNKIIYELQDVSKILDDQTVERYTRQINYLGEFFEDGKGGYKAQKKLLESTVLIFGCGAVGGDIALELVMAGIGSVILYDYDQVEKSDVSRHLYYSDNHIGKNKVYALKDELLKINPDLIVEEIVESMRPDTDIEDIIKRADFVVNTLDEPYIGHTSAKISRICVKNDKPHYIAGGFDAHLASTGELIIPYVTPCVECYAKHFKKVLKDWKPSNHPVEKRYDKIGGLSSMSLFSASYAAIEIIKCLTGIIGDKSGYKVRGEFLFTDMSLTYLNVEKDPECPVCGGGRIE